jgi:hypothetical protein
MEWKEHVAHVRKMRNAYRYKAFILKFQGKGPLIGGGQRVKVVPSIKHHAFKMYGGIVPYISSLGTD